jgi:hypothetical protein
MSGRLASSLLVSALMRRTEVEGGNAVLLSRGDETAGGLLLLALEKGRITGLCEPILDSKSRYVLQSVGPQDIENIEEVNQYIEKRRRFDPDLWVIELDVPNAQRFAAETLAGA